MQQLQQPRPAVANTVDSAPELVVGDVLDWVPVQHDQQMIPMLQLMQGVSGWDRRDAFARELRSA